MMPNVALALHLLHRSHCRHLAYQHLHVIDHQLLIFLGANSMNHYANNKRTQEPKQKLESLQFIPALGS